MLFHISHKALDSKILIFLCPIQKNATCFISARLYVTVRMHDEDFIWINDHLLLTVQPYGCPFDKNVGTIIFITLVTFNLGQVEYLETRSAVDQTNPGQEDLQCFYSSLCCQKWNAPSLSLFPLLTGETQPYSNHRNSFTPFLHSSLLFFLYFLYSPCAGETLLWAKFRTSVIQYSSSDFPRLSPSPSLSAHLPKSHHILQFLPLSLFSPFMFSPPPRLNLYRSFSGNADSSHLHFSANLIHKIVQPEYKILKH